MRRLSSFLALLAIIVGFVVVTAGPAMAASEADYLGLGRHATIEGSWSGDTSWRHYPAGEMMIAIDGGSTEVVAYCIDLGTSISGPSGSNLPEVPWATSGIANLNEVSWILNTYVPGSSLLVGTDDQKAASIQAAIWHYTDGFELRTGAGNDNHANVIVNYGTILADMPAGGLPVEPAPSLAITPATATAYVSAIAGPFTVDTTVVGTLPLTVPTGVQVVDWVTHLPMTAIADGDVFGIASGSVGTVEVSASASATIHAGRVFARLDAEGNPVVQRLILAEQTTATTSASVTATFAVRPPPPPPPPPTTTTTVPPTTTTTVPPTTTTVPETTTTAPEVTTTTTAAATQVLGEVVRPAELPRTGAGNGWLIWVGVSVTLIGALAIAARRRLEGAHDAS